jgi:sulfate adenylyltransferase subunit 2
MASKTRLSHLQALEAESIHILRETAAEMDRAALLYSMGKDSSVLLHLAKKAFFPARQPFPLLHIDTMWKFRDMYAMRDLAAKEHQLIVYRNPDGETRNINPFDHGSETHTHIWKTEGLRKALAEHRFDAAIGGARRDEEKSRAKERVFSLRSAHQRWDPKNQRPELWRLYNTKKRPGESFRVFPLSNWTELDVWQYIEAESIPIVPLYFAAERKVVRRSGAWIMADDERMRFEPGETPELKRVRFRTLGCYPLSGAVESEAASVADIIREIEQSRASERQGRLIDTDTPSSMEKKKQEGYF